MDHFILTSELENLLGLHFSWSMYTQIYSAHQEDHQACWHKF